MKRTIAIILLIVILSSVTAPVHAEPPDIDAEAYILIDANTGRVLCEYNSNTVLYPASTTKVMTALLAIEMGDMDEIMTASAAAVYDIGKDGMNIGIMPGEELTLEDLLNAMMVRSANEAANIIAENLSESREEFINLMNKRARELGALNTNFVNPCGAHDDNHYTTAADLAKIAYHAMKLPKFREVVRKTEHSMSPTNKHSQWDTVLYSTNHLLTGKHDGDYTVTGIKTGYTNPAGHNLVSSAENSSGVSLIAVVMGVRDYNGSRLVAEYSRKLLEYGFENYSIQNIIPRNHVIKKDVEVVDADNNATVSLVAENSLDALLPVDKSQWNLKEEIHINPEITAPVEKGQILGYIKYSSDGFALGKINIIAESSVEKSYKAELRDTVNDRLQSNAFQKGVLIAVIVLLAFFFLRITLRIISRRVKARRKKRRNKYYDY